MKRDFVAEKLMTIEYKEGNATKNNGLDQAHTASGPGVVDVTHMNTSMVGAGKIVESLHGSFTSFNANSNLIHHDEDMQTIVSNHEDSHGNKGVSMDY
ncbi:unnamed protein product [Lupinus luteus]|uniref:Uncharacterized protein n=1 Tax=Lupinus luteus TaxID=3873 RepID=A0AAV1W1C5_LUPLU